MTLLVASIAASTPADAESQLAKAADAGCEAVELRVDHLADCEDVVIRSVAAARPAGMPLILTFRSAAEGGQWDGPDSERISRMIALAPGADYIDVEFATWQRSANIRQKIGLAAREADRDRPARLILSAHDFGGRPDNLNRLLAEMAAVPQAAAVKLAWKARTVRDNFEAFDLMRRSPKPIAAICMGPDGVASRVLARKFGAFATYASVADDLATAPGQLSVERLRSLFRWDAIDSSTRVFGLIGDPVEHSRSPVLHNAAFARSGLNAVYLPFRVGPGFEPFKAFLVEVLARGWLDPGGFSVTAPHKENAVRFARESGAQLDEPSRLVGAANTLVIAADGSIRAENHDVPAAMETIRSLLADDESAALDVSLSGRRVAVLGAGGVARAVVAGCVAAGAEVTVYNRSLERAAVLARDLGCVAKPWDERPGDRHDLVVNCTPLGQSPDVDATPLADERLPHVTAAFDTIYNPPESRFIRSVRSLGRKAAGGGPMLVSQAARQFAAWTGRPPPVAAMTSALVTPA